MDKQRLIENLKRHEGIKLKPYRDTVGKFTIGIGRNLDDVGITEAEAEFLLANDIGVAEGEARELFRRFDTYSDLRQEVLVNMMFNLGRPTLSRFNNMRAALLEDDFDRAADEMKDSRWFRQVGNRAKELVWQMRHDQVGTPDDWQEEE